MLESVERLRLAYRPIFFALEWLFTGIFTLEYVVRLITVRKKRKYALSFFGVVDLLSILPTFVALILTGSQYFMVIRILRLLRMFRVLKMGHHFGQANVLMNALRSSAPKICRSSHGGGKNSLLHDHVEWLCNHRRAGGNRDRRDRSRANPTGGG